MSGVTVGHVYQTHVFPIDNHEKASFGFNLVPGRRQHMMGFAVRSTDSKIKSLLKMKKQLQEQMLVCPCPYGDSNMEFTKLPTDCMRLIVSHLSHPRDVLNLGQADV